MAYELHKLISTLIAIQLQGIRNIPLLQNKVQSVHSEILALHWFSVFVHNGGLCFLRVNRLYICNIFLFSVRTLGDDWRDIELHGRVYWLPQRHGIVGGCHGDRHCSHSGCHPPRRCPRLLVAQAQTTREVTNQTSGTTSAKVIPCWYGTKNYTPSVSIIDQNCLAGITVTNSTYESMLVTQFSYSK